MINRNGFRSTFAREKNLVLVIILVLLLVVGGFLLIYSASSKNTGHPHANMSDYRDSIKQAAIELELSSNASFRIIENFVFFVDRERSYLRRGLCKNNQPYSLSSRGILQDIKWELRSVILNDDFLFDLSTIPPLDLLPNPFSNIEGSPRCYIDRTKMLSLGKHTLSISTQLSSVYVEGRESEPVIIPILSPLEIGVESFSLSVSIPASPSGERPVVKLYVLRVDSMWTAQQLFAEIERAELIPPSDIEEVREGFRINFVGKGKIPPSNYLFLSLKLPFATLDPPYGGVVIANYSNEI